MKTLEEVKAHVSVNGYNQLAIHKIEGFLLGNGLLGGDFEMEYMIGEHTFDDFRKWFNDESNDKNYGKKLKEQLEVMEQLASEMPEDSPFKLFAEAIHDEFSSLIEHIEEENKEVDESDELDKLEVRAKAAVENIIASALSGEMSDDEKHLVLGTLEALVLLGDEYAN